MQAGFESLAWQCHLNITATTGLFAAAIENAIHIISVISILLLCKNVGRIEINNFTEKFICLLPARICLQIVSGYAKEVVSHVIYWNVYHLSWLHLSTGAIVRFTCRLERILEKPCIFLMHRQHLCETALLFQRSPSWYISSLLRRQQQWPTLLLWLMWQLCNPMLSATWERAVTPTFSVLVRSWVSWLLSSPISAWVPLM